MSDVNINELNVAEPKDPSAFAVIATQSSIDEIRGLLAGRDFATFANDIAAGKEGPASPEAIAIIGASMTMGLINLVADHDSDHSIATE